MSNKFKNSTDDISLFHEAMSGTKRYVHEKVALKRKDKREVTPAKRKPDDSHFNLDASLDLPRVESEQDICYKNSSISNKILRKLRKGQYNVDAILDLHGLTIEQAKIEVANFLENCAFDESRVVLIIHGKGTHGDEPVLKNMVNKWLRQIDIVLAFCSANIRHGGRGAVYVLLKKNSNNGDD